MKPSIFYHLLLLLCLSTSLAVHAEDANTQGLDIKSDNDGSNVIMMNAENDPVLLKRVLEYNKIIFPDAKNLPGPAEVQNKTYKLPRFISTSSAFYPRRLRVNQEGQVLVAMLVSEEGLVIDAQVIETTNSRLNAAAVETVKRWNMSPAQLDGIPCKGVVVTPITFRLED